MSNLNSFTRISLSLAVGSSTNCTVSILSSGVKAALLYGEYLVGLFVTPARRDDSANVNSETSLLKNVLEAACTPTVPLENPAEFK